MKIVWLAKTSIEQMCIDLNLRSFISRNDVSIYRYSNVQYQASCTVRQVTAVRKKDQPLINDKPPTVQHEDHHQTETNHNI